MLKDLQENSSIQSFLDRYPQSEWQHCLEAVVLFGISMINKKYPFGLSVEQLFSVGNIESQRSSAGSSNQTRRAHKSLRRVSSKIHEFVQKDICAFKNRVKQHSSTLNTSQFRVIREPKLCTEQEANSFLRTHIDPPKKHTSKMIRIAEDFLNNPLTNSITQSFNKT